MPPLNIALTELPLFADVEHVDVARLTPAFSARVFGRGDMIDQNGANDGRTLVLVSGAVRLVRTGPEGRVVGIGLVEEGGLFGRLPFAQSAATERGEALSPAHAVAVATRDLERIALAYPRVGANLAGLVTQRLAACEQRLASLAFHSVPARLATALLELADRYGRMTPRGIRIELRLTHGQLAEMASTTRETLTKVAGWMRTQGMITLDRNEIWIDDLAAVEGVAGGERQMPGRGMQAVA
jgi:CRP/FNR family cyclic AMP-dependent transcriptional regulator